VIKQTEITTFAICCARLSYTWSFLQQRYACWS